MAAAVVDTGLLARQDDQLDEEGGGDVKGQHERHDEEEDADVRQRREHVAIEVDEPAHGAKDDRDERPVANREVEGRLVGLELERLDHEVGGESRDAEPDRVEVHLLVVGVERWRKAHDEVQGAHDGSDRQGPPCQSSHGERVLVRDGDRRHVAQRGRRQIHRAVLSGAGARNRAADAVNGSLVSRVSVRTCACPIGRGHRSSKGHESFGPRRIGRGTNHRRAEGVARALQAPS